MLKLNFYAVLNFYKKVWRKNMNDEQTNNLTNDIPRNVDFILDEINNSFFEDKNKVIDSTTKVYNICQEYHNLELAERCVLILKNLYVNLEVIAFDQQQDCTKEFQDIIDKVYSVYQKFPKSDCIAKQYLSILGILALIQKDNRITHDIVAKTQSVYQQFPNPEKIAEEYINILEDLSCMSPLLNEELQNIVTEAQSVYQKFPKRKEIASSYLGILWNFTVKQKNLDELRKSTDKAYSIYKYFSDKDIAFHCIFFLEELAKKQENLNELEETIAKADEIYESFPNLENIVSEYILILLQLAKKQDTLDELHGTIRKVLEIYRSFLERTFVFDRLSIIESSAYFISEYINNFLINPLEEEKDKTNDRCNILIKELYNVETKLIVTVIDQIFSFPNNFRPLTNNRAQIMSRLLSHFGNIVSLRETKYSVMMNLIEDLEKNGYDIEPFVKTYCMVQTIKFQLSMKDLSKEDFGHYTSGKVLQILLKQNSDNEESRDNEQNSDNEESSDNEQNSDNKKSRDNQKHYSIEGRTRLGNAKYMNDPEEGSVLDRYLELGKSHNLEDSLKPSPWFLMSLTTAIDDLSMWAQYGARAEGVCLVFKPDSFKAVKSMAEAEWMKEKKSNPDSEKNKDSTKKDFLYRICYLDEKSVEEENKEENLGIVKKKYNKKLDEMEIDTINYCLDKIKSIVSKIDKNTILYSFVDDCLEEIRYLFKVSDYSYESELRILRYADLNPYNNNIKIDNSGPIAKLYLERDFPIQLKQVIFGPKFSNPEHVTPLLHLLDKNIEFKRSEIKFK